ncbi:MAG: formylglycine-generating enzyme family protein [Alphaproteobacteria bacterium]|nr:formylglycine-generating enzyme family protein [Alphaproteobacteria bacterium]
MESPSVTTPSPQLVFNHAAHVQVIERGDGYQLTVDGRRWPDPDLARILQGDAASRLLPLAAALRALGDTPVAIREALLAWRLDALAAQAEGGWPAVLAFADDAQRGQLYGRAFPLEGLSPDALGSAFQAAVAAALLLAPLDRGLWCVFAERAELPAVPKSPLHAWVIALVERAASFPPTRQRPGGPLGVLLENAQRRLEEDGWNHLPLAELRERWTAHLQHQHRGFRRWLQGALAQVGGLTGDWGAALDPRDPQPVPDAGPALTLPDETLRAERATRKREMEELLDEARRLLEGPPMRPEALRAWRQGRDQAVVALSVARQYQQRGAPDPALLALMAAYEVEALGLLERARARRAQQLGFLGGVAVAMPGPLVALWAGGFRWLSEKLLVVLLVLVGVFGAKRLVDEVQARGQAEVGAVATEREVQLVAGLLEAQSQERPVVSERPDVELSPVGTVMPEVDGTADVEPPHEPEPIAEPEPAEVTEPAPHEPEPVAEPEPPEVSEPPPDDPEPVEVSEPPVLDPTGDDGVTAVETSEDPAPIEVTEPDAAPGELGALDGVATGTPTVDDDGPTGHVVGRFVVPGGSGVEMVQLSGGRFRMGSTAAEREALVPEEFRELYENEGPVHAVTLSGFSIATTETTQAQFQERMGYNPSDRRLCRDCPVEQVSWYEAAAYCNALSQDEGLPLCYACSGEGADVTCSATASPSACGYRLPTEAEWEYAARAGSTTAYWWGDDTQGLDAHTWHAGNSSDKTHAVGAEGHANLWGLSDMLGNVHEWTHDYLGTYGQAAVTNPLGSDETRGVRGGSFVLEPWFLRSAGRFRFSPVDRGGVLGFRCARSGPD